VASGSMGTSRSYVRAAPISGARFAAATPAHRVGRGARFESVLARLEEALQAFARANQRAWPTALYRVYEVRPTSAGAVVSQRQVDTDAWCT
jgi:hypothetical protein